MNRITKPIIAVITYIISITTNLNAQVVNQALVAWEGYRIPLDVKGATIGKFMGHDINAIKGCKLISDTSSFFSLTKSGVLKLKNSVALTNDDGPHSFGISLSAGGRLFHIELVKDQFIKNKVIAHRGAWRKSGVMQNSIRSFEKAVELGCEGSEFDVWLSKDNKVILSHDPHIGGLSVESSTAEELYHSTLPAGDPVPALADFIELAKNQNRTKMVLEIKGSQKGRSLQLTDSVISIVHRLKAQAYIEYISFDYQVLQRIRQLDPSAKTAYLYGNKTVEELDRDQVSGLDYDFYHFRNDPDLVKKAKKYGLTTNVWTVNNPEELQFYLTSDVEMITTDEPELLLELIKNKITNKR